MQAQSKRPLPDMSERMRPFFEAARERRFVLQHCDRCATAYFPAIELCRSCLRSDAFTWKAASGRGTVYSYVVVHQVYHPAFAAEIPYAVADILLAEGPHMTSRVIGLPISKLRIGLDVQVVFERVDDVLTLPVFRPA